MNKYLKLFLFLVIGVNCFFSLWYLLHGDIYFHTDIARDFLLLDDLWKRKLVLIGPRSSGPGGFYHGPLWMYLNFPAFILSKGNPVVVGWFWILLSILFLFTSYWVAKRIFNAKTALIFTTLLSLFPSIPFPGKSWLNGYYNPFGAMFLIPLFFYSLTTYAKEKKARWLILSLFLCGCMFQFQVAFGGPILILTTIFTLYSIVKNKTYSHIAAFLILILPFSTYIAFDLRHDFSHVRAILNLAHDPYAVKIPFLEVVKQRLGMMCMVGLHFFREPHDVFGLFYMLAMAFGYYFVFVSKKIKNKVPYYLGLYLYVGYFVLSCIHNGWLMYYYWMPIFPLVFLIFSSFESVLPKRLFYLLLCACLISNILISHNLMTQSKEFIGIHEESWKFQSSLAQTVFKDANGTDFGFFIYSPDIFAYSSKYPFVYHQKLNPQTKMAIYERKPLTYLVIAPAPKEKPWMTGDWWKANKVGIKKSPDKVFTFANGYKIERYHLEGKDFDIPMDQNLNDWIYFR